MNDCNHEAEHEAAALRAKEKMLSDETVENLSREFKALSEPSRLKILLALREGELCVYHIVEAVGGTQSAVSHQLRIMRESRMIRARRDGQNIVYSIADAHVLALLELACAHLGCSVE